VIGQFLKDRGFASPIRKLAASEEFRIAFETWVLQQLANFLYQLYLFPSLVIPGFAVRRGCSAGEASFVRFVHQFYVAQLLETGWVVKDPTGILYLPEVVSKQLDELAKSLHS
jgi:hypothetical protein